FAPHGLACRAPSKRAPCGIGRRPPPPRRWRGVARTCFAQESMGSTGMSNVVRRILAGAILCVAANAVAPAALAEGAIAIGASGNFAKDGFAFGAAINKANTAEANQQALE